MAKTPNYRGVYQRSGIQPGNINKAGERRITPVVIGQKLTGAQDIMIFRAPESGAKIQSVSLNFGSPSAMRHDPAEEGTWIFNLIDSSDASELMSADASLSGITVAATGWAILDDLDNGNATLEAGAGLMLQLTISGTPQTMDSLSAHVNWLPAFNE